MMQYTLFCIISIFLVFWLDKALKTNLFKKNYYWQYLGIMFGFMMIVNTALTMYAVFYDSKQILGLRIGTIPVEDFLFGFSMISLTIMLWEKFKK